MIKGPLLALDYCLDVQYDKKYNSVDFQIKSRSEVSLCYQLEVCQWYWLWRTILFFFIQVVNSSLFKWRIQVVNSSLADWLCCPRFLLLSSQHYGLLVVEVDFVALFLSMIVNVHSLIHFLRKSFMIIRFTWSGRGDFLFYFCLIKMFILWFPLVLVMSLILVGYIINHFCT